MDELTRGSWVLDSNYYDEDEELHIQPIGITFLTNGTVEGWAACNSYSGSYSISNNTENLEATITFERLAPLTEAACKDDADVKHLDTLMASKSLVLTNTDLILSGTSSKLGFIRPSNPHKEAQFLVATEIVENLMAQDFDSAADQIDTDCWSDALTEIRMDRFNQMASYELLKAQINGLADETGIVKGTAVLKNGIQMSLTVEMRNQNESWAVCSVSYQRMSR